MRLRLSNSSQLVFDTAYLCVTKFHLTVAGCTGHICIVFDVSRMCAPAMLMETSRLGMSQCHTLSHATLSGVFYICSSAIQISMPTQTCTADYRYITTIPLAGFIKLVLHL